MKKIFTLLVVFFLLLNPIIVALETQETGEPAAEEEEMSAEDFSKIEDPTPEDLQRCSSCGVEQFNRLDQNEQASYLQSNYKEEFADHFFGSPDNVGVNPTVEKQYFSQTGNVEQNRDSATKFLRLRYNAPYSIDPQASGLRYDQTTETFASGNKVISLAAFAGNPEIKGIIAIPNGFQFITAREGETESRQINFGGTGSMNLQFDTGTRTFRTSDEAGQATGTFTTNVGNSVVEMDENGDVRVTGPASGVITRHEEEIRFENREGSLIIQNNGDIYADNAEINTQYMYVDGRFSRQGNDVTSYSYDGKDTIVVDKRSGVGTRTQGQSRERGEYVITHLGQYAPDSAYTPKSLNPEGTQPENPTPPLTDEEARIRARELRMARPDVGMNGEVWIAGSKDGEIHVYARGRVEVASFYVEGNIVQGIDPMKPNFKGENGRAVFDYLAEGDRDRFQIIGNAAYADRQINMRTANDGAFVSRMMNLNQQEGEFYEVQCDGCAAGTEAATIQKRMTIVQTSERRIRTLAGTRERVLLGEEVAIDNTELQGGVTLKFTQTDKGVVTAIPTANLHELASFTQASGTTVAIDRNFFVRTGEGENWFGVTTGGIGVYERTDEGFVSHSVGLDMNIKSTIGDIIIPASDQERAAVNTFLNALGGGRYRDLRSVEGIRDERVKNMLERETGINVNYLQTNDEYERLVVSGLNGLAAGRRSGELRTEPQTIEELQANVNYYQRNEQALDGQIDILRAQRLVAKAEGKDVTAIDQNIRRLRRQEARLEEARRQVEVTVEVRRLATEEESQVDPRVGEMRALRTDSERADAEIERINQQIERLEHQYVKGEGSPWYQSDASYAEENAQWVNPELAKLRSRREELATRKLALEQSMDITASDLQNNPVLQARALMNAGRYQEAQAVLQDVAQADPQTSAYLNAMISVEGRDTRGIRYDPTTNKIVFTERIEGVEAPTGEITDPAMVAAIQGRRREVERQMLSEEYNRAVESYYATVQKNEEFAKEREGFFHEISAGIFWDEPDIENEQSAERNARDRLYGNSMLLTIFDNGGCNADGGCTIQQINAMNTQETRDRMASIRERVNTGEGLHIAGPLPSLTPTGEFPDERFLTRFNTAQQSATFEMARLLESGQTVSDRYTQDLIAKQMYDDAQARIRANHLDASSEEETFNYIAREFGNTDTAALAGDALKQIEDDQTLNFAGIDTGWNIGISYQTTGRLASEFVDVTTILPFAGLAAKGVIGAGKWGVAAVRATDTFVDVERAANTITELNRAREGLRLATAAGRAEEIATATARVAELQTTVNSLSTATRIGGNVIVRAEEAAALGSQATTWVSRANQNSKVLFETTNGANLRRLGQEVQTAEQAYEAARVAGASTETLASLSQDVMRAREITAQYRTVMQAESIAKSYTGIRGVIHSATDSVEEAGRRIFRLPRTAAAREEFYAAVNTFTRAREGSDAIQLTQAAERLAETSSKFQHARNLLAPAEEAVDNFFKGRVAALKAGQPPLAVEITQKAVQQLPPAESARLTQELDEADDALRTLSPEVREGLAISKEGDVVAFNAQAVAELSQAEKLQYDRAVEQLEEIVSKIHERNPAAIDAAIQATPGAPEIERINTFVTQADEISAHLAELPTEARVRIVCTSPCRMVVDNPTALNALSPTAKAKATETLQKLERVIAEAQEIDPEGFRRAVERIRQAEQQVEKAAEAAEASALQRGEDVMDATRDRMVPGDANVHGTAIAEQPRPTTARREPANMDVASMGEERAPLNDQELDRVAGEIIKTKPEDVRNEVLHTEIVDTLVEKIQTVDYRDIDATTLPRIEREADTIDDLIDTVYHAAERDPLTGEMRLQAFTNDVAAMVERGEAVYLNRYKMPGKYMKNLNDAGKGDEGIIVMINTARSEFRREGLEIRIGTRGPEMWIAVDNQADLVKIDEIMNTVAKTVEGQMGISGLEFSRAYAPVARRTGQAAGDAVAEAENMVTAGSKINEARGLGFAEVKAEDVQNYVHELAREGRDNEILQTLDMFDQGDYSFFKLGDEITELRQEKRAILERVRSGQATPNDAVQLRQIASREHEIAEELGRTFRSHPKWKTPEGTPMLGNKAFKAQLAETVQPGDMVFMTDMDNFASVNLYFNNQEIQRSLDEGRSVMDVLGKMGRKGDEVIQTQFDLLHRSLDDLAREAGVTRTEAYALGALGGEEAGIHISGALIDRLAATKGISREEAIQLVSTRMREAITNGMRDVQYQLWDRATGKFIEAETLLSPSISGGYVEFTADILASKEREGGIAAAIFRRADEMETFAKYKPGKNFMAGYGQRLSENEIVEIAANIESDIQKALANNDLAKLRILEENLHSDTWQSVFRSSGREDLLANLQRSVKEAGNPAMRSVSTTGLDEILERAPATPEQPRAVIVPQPTPLREGEIIADARYEGVQEGIGELPSIRRFVDVETGETFLIPGELEGEALEQAVRAEAAVTRERALARAEEIIEVTPEMIVEEKVVPEAVEEAIEVAPEMVVEERLAPEEMRFVTQENIKQRFGVDPYAEAKQRGERLPGGVSGYAQSVDLGPEGKWVVKSWHADPSMTPEYLALKKRGAQNELVIREIIRDFFPEFEVSDAYAYTTEDRIVVLNKFVEGAISNPEKFNKLTPQQRAEMSILANVFGLSDTNYQNVLFGRERPILIDFEMVGREALEVSPEITERLVRRGYAPFVDKSGYNELQLYLDEAAKWKARLQDPAVRERLRIAMERSGISPADIEEYFKAIDTNMQNFEANTRVFVDAANNIAARRTIEAAERAKIELAEVSSESLDNVVRPLDRINDIERETGIELNVRARCPGACVVERNQAAINSLPPAQRAEAEEAIRELEEGLRIADADNPIIQLDITDIEILASAEDVQRERALVQINREIGEAEQHIDALLTNTPYTPPEFIGSRELIVEDGVAEIAAIGDVQGNYREMIRALQKAGVIDADGQWIGGNKRFVFLGDLVDKGPDTAKVLDFATQLSRDAEAAGGRVIVLRGNHEDALLDLIEGRPLLGGEDFWWDDNVRVTAKSFLRETGISEERITAMTDDQLKLEFRRYMIEGEGRKYVQFLKDLPVAAKINNGFFVHGAPDFAARSLARVGKGEEARILMTWSRKWESRTADIEQFKKMAGVDYIVYGHTQKGELVGGIEGVASQYRVATDAQHGLIDLNVIPRAAPEGGAHAVLTMSRQGARITYGEAGGEFVSELEDIARVETPPTVPVDDIFRARERQREVEIRLQRLLDQRDAIERGKLIPELPSETELAKTAVQAKPESPTLVALSRETPIVKTIEMPVPEIRRTRELGIEQLVVREGGRELRLMPETAYREFLQQERAKLPWYRRWFTSEADIASRHPEIASVDRFIASRVGTLPESYNKFDVAEQLLIGKSSEEALTTIRMQKLQGTTIATLEQKLNELEGLKEGAKRLSPEQAALTLRSVAREQTEIRLELARRVQSIEQSKLQGTSLETLIAPEGFIDRQTIIARSDTITDALRNSEMSNDEITTLATHYRETLRTRGVTDEPTTMLEDIEAYRKELELEGGYLDFVGEIDKHFPQETQKVFLGTDGMEYLEYTYQIMTGNPNPNAFSHYISRKMLATKEEWQSIMAAVERGEGEIEDLVSAHAGKIRLYTDAEEVISRASDAVKEGMDFNTVLLQEFDAVVMTVPSSRQHVIELVAALQRDVDLTQPVVLVDYAGRAHVQTFTLREGIQWIGEHWDSLTQEQQALLGNDRRVFQTAQVEMHVGVIKYDIVMEKTLGAMTPAQRQDAELLRRVMRRQPLAGLNIEGIYQFNYGGYDLVEDYRGITVDDLSLLTGEPVFVPTTAGEQARAFQRKLIIADVINERRMAVAAAAP